MRRISALAATDGALPDVLAGHAHAYTRVELIHRWSRHALDRAVNAGTVARVLPGVYAASALVRHPVVMGDAATLWAPRAVVTGELALRLYRDSLPAPPHVDLVAANGDPLHPPPWVRVHQTGVPRLRGLPAGIRCTLPARALLDAWRLAPPHRRRSVLWEALWTRVCTWRQLQVELESAPRVTGRRDLERVLRWFAAGATTPLEVQARRVAFADARFRDFEWQAEIRLGNRRVTVDMLHRGATVAVELDGDAYHSTRRARDNDRERQTELTAAGYVVVRFGWRDVCDRPDWCRDRLLRAVAARVARPSSR